ncbi:hypothetical protein [Actinomadura sp. DC4]|uniref:hypothetical protein n=1 Tax=Actinomadura sp. DC4 TaxID=3055069 RepID=UPI0025B1B20A|nr:hypothetical protein [Actinomadura sp. DC4]MDN3358231.1 hypothetical protein [Actinomadura sp. DC4]
MGSRRPPREPPSSAQRKLRRRPRLLNLAGYVIGTLVLSPIADTIGRRNMPLTTESEHWPLVLPFALAGPS